MQDGWLKCAARSGVMDNEFIVAVCTNEGIKHFFADKSLVRQTDGGYEVKVKCLPLFSQNGQLLRIRLPQEPIEHNIDVAVSVDAVRHLDSDLNDLRVVT